MGHEHAPVWWNFFVGFFWTSYARTPHRYAIPGATRVRYEFCVLADELIHLQDYFDKRAKSEGLVVGYEYSYQGPGGHRSPPPGTYTRNTKFPEGFIVQPDGGGPLVCVPIENAELISGYGHAIPRRHSMSREQQRIGDLPKPIIAYPKDLVRFKEDAPGVERNVVSISFTGLGTPVYAVCRTPAEVVAENASRENAAKGTHRGWIVCPDGDIHSYVREEAIELVRRGNVYHLFHGAPDDLSFDSLRDEVDFWKRWAGEWLADTHVHSARRYRSSTREEAQRRIEAGEFEIAVKMIDDFTPVRILDRYERFRARARAAGLEHLRADDD